jgi:hypothetical protein
VFPPAATVAPGGDTFSGGLGILHSFWGTSDRRFIDALRRVFWLAVATMSDYLDIDQLFHFRAPR